MLASGIEPRLPDVSAPHIANYLFDIGATEPAGMGETVVSSSEIIAWQTGMGIELNPFEFRSIRVLSGEFLAQKNISGKPDCPAPYAGTSEEQQRDAVAKKVREMFRARMTTQQRGKRG